jgi:hypothetical protein
VETPKSAVDTAGQEARDPRVTTSNMGK